MLVLTRKCDEAIIIGGNIEVRVVGIQNGKVRLGVTAPRDVPVHRCEIQDRIRYERISPSPAGTTIVAGTVAG